MNNIEKIMNTIKWVNDTFVPWGLKPIEDLPEAVPGQGDSCVIAKVLRDGFPALESVHVSTKSITFTVPYWKGTTYLPQSSIPKMDILWIGDSQFPVDDELDMPEEVQMFINEFDHGLFPELIDTELTVAKVGEQEAHDAYRIGCDHTKDCNLCPPEDFAVTSDTV
tara:strand:- start:987 stop:1484 length:498 start_codon:yes stop_codon:yes gene_type:complete